MHCKADPDVAAAEVAGPGFINIRAAAGFWPAHLGVILSSGDDYGRGLVGKGMKVNVEYVSANPTGPMHVGHCRGAVVGDALANLLDFAGYDVTQEYVINDAGAQIDVLARSVFLRYREALGEEHRRNSGWALSRRLSRAARHRRWRRSMATACKAMDEASRLAICASVPSTR